VIADFNPGAEKEAEDAIFPEDLFYSISLWFFEPQSPPVVFQDEAGWSEGRSGPHRLIMTMQHQLF
jgi:hypothetical protein